MNKATRGVLAIAAATVLLLGGASSIAYWQASATTDAVDFTMGTLGIEANDDGQWTRNGEVIDETALLIPGDHLTYTQTFDVEVSGDGMLITAEVEKPEIQGWDGADLGTYASLSAEDDVLEAIDNRTWSVTKSGTITLEAMVMVLSGNEQGQGETIGVDGFRVVLQQVAELPDNPCAC